MMYDWGGGLWMWIAMALFWIFLIAGAIWLVQTLSRGDGAGRDSARRILEQRLARGEIDPDEFRARAALL